MKILLTGKSGQLGWELQRSLSALGEVVAPTSQELDLSDPDSIALLVRAVRPRLIVNPAAYTAVDRAESEPERAMAVNARAPGILAEEAARCGAAMLHYSTDYVFDGEKQGAYSEGDVTAPLNVYGRSKLAGEQAVLAAGIPCCILRTSWVYGLRGQNFLLTMRRLMQEREQLRVIDDQLGAPTWCRWLAEASACILARGELPVGQEGLYHLTPSGSTSWHGFAAALQKRWQSPIALQAISSAEYPVAARRPRNSCLDGRRVELDFRLQRPDWEYLLDLCLDAGEALR